MEIEPRHPNRKRSGYRGHCQLCGVWRESLHRDHIVPKRKGGTEEDGNIQYLCANCHEDKSRADLSGGVGSNRGRTWSPEVRARMSAAQQARETHPGLSAALDAIRGKPLSPERRAHLRELALVREQRKRDARGA